MIVRCHQLKAFMTEPKTKEDREKGLLSETTKKLIADIFLFDKFGYKEPLITDPIMKGLYSEQESLKLVQKVLKGQFRAKNTEVFKNDIISGTPDVVIDLIEDIKTSYTLSSYFNTKESKSDYYWQMQGYMWLTGKKNARVIHTLLPSSEEAIMNEKKKFFYKFNQQSDHPEYIKISQQIEHNNKVILTIPDNKRVKVIDIPFDPNTPELIKSRWEKAKVLYDSLMKEWEI